MHGIHRQRQTLLGDHEVPDGERLHDLRGVPEKWEKSGNEVMANAGCGMPNAELKQKQLFF